MKQVLQLFRVAPVIFMEYSATKGTVVTGGVLRSTLLHLPTFDTLATGGTAIWADSASVSELVSLFVVCEINNLFAMK
jgi:hypothetical protein